MHYFGKDLMAKYFSCNDFSNSGTFLKSASTVGVQQMTEQLKTLYAVVKQDEK